MSEQQTGSYNDLHGPEARKRRAAERQADRDARSDEEQLELIKDRRGASKKETARMKARIAGRTKKKKKGKDPLLDDGN